MAIFDGISKKITSAGQNVVKGTKDFTDVARLNSLISDEHRQVAALYARLGEMFYVNYGERLSELGTDGQRFTDNCGAISDSLSKIARYQEEVQQIKGIKQCVKCGGEIPAGAAFCSFCGNVVEKPVERQTAQSEKKLCASCGAELSGTAAFCTSCGQRVQ